MVTGKHYAEARVLACEIVTQCRQAIGPEHTLTLALRLKYAEALYRDENACHDDEAVATIEDVVNTWRRVFGLKHPYTVEALRELNRARMTLEDVASPAQS